MARRWGPVACGAGAVALAVGLSLQAGRVGFMPLDQSIVFDGGYRVLDGQLPIRDFVAPAGSVPSILQAGFFALLGRTWFAYCLHAALLNGLFVLLVHRFLVLLGSGRWIAWAWAALSGVVFTPPVGTPLVDHHAFFFGLAAVAALLQAGTARPAAAWTLAAAVPALLLASVLSKPTVAPFLAPALGLVMLRADRPRRARLFAGLGLGVGIALVGAAGAALVAGISWQRVSESMWEIPLALGRRRTFAAGSRGRNLLDDLLLVRWLSPFVVLALSVWLARRPHNGEATEAPSSPRIDLALSSALLLAGVGYAVVSYRPSLTSWGYLFAALGGVQAVAAKRLVARPTARTALSFVLLLLGLHDAASLHLRVTRTRYATLIAPTHVPPAGEPVRLPEPLALMRWAAPANFGYPWQDLAGVVRFFADRPGGFWLLGDSTILYSLTGRPSVHPTLWMFPPPSTLAAERRREAWRWQRQLLQTLERDRVRYVVLESPQTQMGVSLDTFPAVAAAVRRGTVEQQQIGAFTILRVRPRVWRRALAAPYPPAAALKTPRRGTP